MASEMGWLILADRAQILGQQGDLAPMAAAGPAPATGFAQSLASVLHSVDARERAAGDKMAEVDSGQSDDLVGAMVLSQEASLSFSMLTQVRNKVVGAVDELIKMQL